MTFNESPLYIGVMSGTSLDGVDAALCTFPKDQPCLVAQHFLPMPLPLREQLMALQTPGPNELHLGMMAGNELARLYAEVVNGLLLKTEISAAAIKAIACHGQTVRHQPSQGYTVQLNNGALLAELTDIDVICDFRSRDIAAAGQGAPLVPSFHAAAFKHPEIHRAVVNIGGMANITNIPSTDEISGFDCGPGNVLMDTWTQATLGCFFDANGSWARTGKVDVDLLKDFLAHPFFDKSPPKSCGREDFNRDWLLNIIAERNLAPENIQATLLELTAQTIANALMNYCAGASQLLVCGGGARNSNLLERLTALLPGTAVSTTDAYGLAHDAIEASAFAWLGYCFINKKAGNLPQVTGAIGPRILGALYPR